MAAFEIEIKTATNANHIKGSVTNLDNLGAQMGVTVIGQSNLDALRKLASHRDKNSKELEKILMERIYRCVYAESQPRSRIVIMSEAQVVDWARRLGVAIPEMGMT